jgi:hypothetical protein
MDARAQAEVAHRLDQELAQLLGALVVAPVADPHQVALARLARHRTEEAMIRRLVPGPRTRRPPLAQVDVAHRGAEGQHAVVVREVVACHRLAFGDRAVVRVVEEQPPGRAGRAPLAQPAHQRVVVPLVHEHQRRTVERRVQRGVVGTTRRMDVAHAVELRIRATPALQRLGPALGHQVLRAPRVGRLPARHLVTGQQQLTRDAAQEVRVAVVPVGRQRVAEDHDAHGTASSTPGDATARDASA